jgi:hypothetical protein
MDGVCLCVCVCVCVCVCMCVCVCELENVFIQCTKEKVVSWGAVTLRPFGTLTTSWPAVPAPDDG